MTWLTTMTVKSQFPVFFQTCQFSFLFLPTKQNSDQFVFSFCCFQHSQYLYLIHSIMHQINIQDSSHMYLKSLHTVHANTVTVSNTVPAASCQVLDVYTIRQPFKISFLHSFTPTTLCKTNICSTQDSSLVIILQ